MRVITEHAAAYRAMKEAQADHSGQVAAAQLVCGLDLYAVLDADASTARAAVARLERAIERERLKGWRRHWSYDLNRHIALKQALDRLRAGLVPPAAPEGGIPTKNGA